MGLQRHPFVTSSTLFGTQRTEFLPSVFTETCTAKEVSRFHAGLQAGLPVLPVLVGVDELPIRQTQTDLGGASAEQETIVLPPGWKVVTPQRTGSSVPQRGFACGSSDLPSHPTHLRIN